MKNSFSSISIIGRGIKKLRKQLRLTQDNLSEMSGVNLSTILKIERFRTNPNINTLDKIAKALGTTLGGLLAAGHFPLSEITNEIKKVFGKTVKLKRFEIGYNRRQLGEKAGFVQQYIGTIENGVNIPSLTNIIKIAAALECSTFDLLFGLGNSLEFKGREKSYKTNRSSREIVDFLTRARKERNLTTSQLTQVSGINTGQIINIENYEHEPILAYVIVLSNAMQINLHDIVQK